MTTIRLIGDVHGHFNQYKRLIKESPHKTIVVGDMGVGFFRHDNSVAGGGDVRSMSNPPYDTMVEHDARFIRGNHDNPSVCSRHSQWIKDGTVEKIGDSKAMFVGGAWSIDFQYRTLGLDWWRDEEVSEKRFQETYDTYVKEKPDVLVTHDGPESVVKALFIDGTHKPLYRSRTGGWLQAMIEAHRPRLWVFGHWHVSSDQVVEGTRCVCLAELEYKDFQL